MVQGVPCADGGNWGRERDILLALRDRMRVLQRKFWHGSCLIRSFHIQRCRSFSERVGPRLLESQPGKQSSRSKRSHEITTGPITVWFQTAKTLTNKGSQCCCYYLEHCSETKHIAIKRAKYENVLGLLAYMRLLDAQNMSRSIRISVTWNKDLITSKWVGFLVGCREKNLLWFWRQIVRGNCAGLLANQCSCEVLNQHWS